MDTDHAPKVNDYLLCKTILKERIGIETVASVQVQSFLTFGGSAAPTKSIDSSFWSIRYNLSTKNKGFAPMYPLFTGLLCSYMYCRHFSIPHVTY